MSKYRYEAGGIIRDLELDMSYHTDDIVDLLTEKDQQIAELKQQFANIQKEYQEYREVVTEDIEKEVDERMRDTIKEFNLDITELQKQLEEKEKEIEHWHNLYQERDRQFQSVRQRYHLLNRLKSNYNEKDKLHLSEMQCLELVEENEELQKQLQSQPAEIVEKIKGIAIIDVEEYSNDPILYKITEEELDTILKEYQK